LVKSLAGDYGENKSGGNPYDRKRGTGVRVVGEYSVQNTFRCGKLGAPRGKKKGRDSVTEEYAVKGKKIFLERSGRKQRKNSLRALWGGRGRRADSSEENGARTDPWRCEFRIKE